MAKKRTFNRGTNAGNRERAEWDEPILPSQVANQNAGFASSFRLRIQPNNVGTLGNEDSDSNGNDKKPGLDWQNN